MIQLCIFAALYGVVSNYMYIQVLCCSLWYPCCYITYSPTYLPTPTVTTTYIPTLHTLPLHTLPTYVPTYLPTELTVLGCLSSLPPGGCGRSWRVGSHTTMMLQWQHYSSSSLASLLPYTHMYCNITIVTCIYRVEHLKYLTL